MILLLLALMLPAALCLLPMQITLDLHHGLRTLIRVQLKYPLIQKEWRMELLHTPQGRQLVISGSGEPHKADLSAMSDGPLDKLFKQLRKNARARRFLLHHIHVSKLDAQLRLHLQSAASTALLTGAARSFAAILPSRWRAFTRLSIQPDFLLDTTTLNARCIFSLRPGTLILTAGLLAASSIAAKARKAREALSTWNTPSVN